MGLECYSACCGENQIWVGVEWTVVADEGYECIYDVKKDRAIFFRNIQGWLNEARNDAVAELLGQIRSSEGEYIQFFDTSVLITFGARLSNCELDLVRKSQKNSIPGRSMSPGTTTRWAIGRTNCRFRSSSASSKSDTARRFSSGRSHAR